MFADSLTHKEPRSRCKVGPQEGPEAALGQACQATRGPDPGGARAEPDVAGVWSLGLQEHVLCFRLNFRARVYTTPESLAKMKREFCKTS